MTEGRVSIPLRYLLLIGHRDKWTCHVCGQGYRPGDDYRWEVDHDQALAKGGRNLLSNLKLAHRCCNREKHVA